MNYLTTTSGTISFLNKMDTNEPEKGGMPYAPPTTAKSAPTYVSSLILIFLVIIYLFLG